MKRVSASALPVLTLSEAKDHLRVLHDDDDLLISSLIDSAKSWLDGWHGVLGRCIGEQVWQRSADDIAAGITMPDLTASVDNGDGTENITCKMPDSITPSVKLAAKLLVGHWYETREAVGKPMEMQPLAVRALLDPLRAV